MKNYTQQQKPNANNRRICLLKSKIMQYNTSNLQRRELMQQVGIGNKRTVNVQLQTIGRQQHFINLYLMLIKLQNDIQVYYYNIFIGLLERLGSLERRQPHTCFL